MYGNSKRLLYGLMLVAGAGAVATGCSDSGTKTQPTVSTDTTAIEQAVQSGDRYIVEFEPGSAAAGRAAVTGAGGEIVLEIFNSNAVASRLSDTAASALQNNPNVRLIEKDPVREAFADPSTTNEVSPYGIAMVQADQVSDASAASRTVCIIDSGYDVAHEDLENDASVTGYTPSDGTNPWDGDGCGHGSHVAGTIAALGGNGKGVVGVNPSGNVNLYIVRVFGDDCGWAYASDLADAARRCEAAGSDVISMSLGCASGGPFCYSSFEDATFQDLYDNSGILNVAAASNDGKSWYSYPASYESVVSVAAIDSNKQHASFSNHNDAVELAAPGVGVWSTLPADCYYCDPGQIYGAWNGTSMATPHVAAVAALVWSHDADGTVTNAELRSALRAAAEDLGAAGKDDYYGYGLVRAKATLDYLALNASPGCSTDADCDDSNECTTDSCVSGTCSNTAANEGGTCGGGTGLCCSGSCTTPVCSDDAACNDNNECTTDACLNAGTCGATCDNTAVADGTQCATGLCCSGACSSPECTDSTDCDDGDICTDDTCTSGGTCNAICESTHDDTNDSTCSCQILQGACSADVDCCSGKCRGKPGAMSCK